MLFDQLVQRVVESVGLQLLFEVDDNHRVLAVIVLPEVWHAGDPPIGFANFTEKTLSFGAFLQPQRPHLRLVWSAAENPGPSTANC